MMTESLGYKKTPVTNRGYFVPGHQKPYSFIGLDGTNIQKNNTKTNI